MDLTKAMMISAAGMQVQSTRMKVISENLANADSISTRPGGDPYRRKVLSFANELDKKAETNLVRVKRITTDSSPFGLEFDPGNPAAGPQGYVKLPNVNSLIEVSDMREAQRTYEANLTVIESVKAMMARTIDLLR
ncbi:MAG: flagellar basal body rod protein FlgC [Sneathiellaceae bacterium]|uniref:flagellar basal body rod protein FlgC n=1 Tax=Marinovum algicola TaxID=42444 RepID=UPI0032EC1970